MPLFLNGRSRIPLTILEDCWFIYLPSREAIAAELEPLTSIRPKDRVLAIVRELGIRVVDLSPALAAPPGIKSRFVFPEMGHYNENG